MHTNCARRNQRMLTGIVYPGGTLREREAHVNQGAGERCVRTMLNRADTVNAEYKNARRLRLT